MTDRVEPPFVGESRHKIVDGLVTLLTDVQLHERALWVSIEAPSGWGKTRVAHAFYEKIAGRQEKRYWPATILEGTDATLHDVASRRKRVFPEPSCFDREAGSLPEFFWWGIACDLRNGVPTQILQQDLGQLEAHSVFLEAAWSALVKGTEKYGMSGERARQVALKLAEESATEGAGFLAQKLLEVSLPGLGLAVDLAKFGFGKAQAGRDQRRAIAQAGVLPNDEKIDIVEEAAATLKRLARPGLPVIVFIEDLHRDNGLVSRLLDNLLRANAPVLILTTTWPGELEQSEQLFPLLSDPVIGDRIYRLHHNRPVPEVFPPGASMDALSPDALRALIQSYYPVTSGAVLDGLAARYNNPLPIEIICTLPKHRNRSRDGALRLSAEEIGQLPRQVSDLYRQLWNELPYRAQCALALSTLAIPESDAAWHRDLVRKALEPVAGLIDGSDSPAISPDDVPHGWVREIEDWLRRFNEPDQMRIAREDLEERALFGDEVIAPFLDALVAQIVADGLRNGDEAQKPTDEAQYRAWLILALRSTGRIDDDLVLDGILLLLTALSDKPLEARRCLLLGEVFHHMRVASDDERALKIRANLASTLGETGRVDEAMAAIETLLTDQRRILGEDHPDVLITRNNLAHWFGETGRVDEAIAAFEALLPDERRVLGEDHPEVLRTRGNLACWFGEAGRVDEAIAAFEALLTDQYRILGEDHPDVLIARNNLAGWLGQAGRVDEAMAAIETLLADQRRILGEDHPDVLLTRNNLAHWFGQAGRVDEAIAAFEALLRDQRRVLGDDHFDVLRTRNNLAHWFGHVGRVGEAIAAFQALLMDQRRILGDDHPEVLRSRNNLAYWFGQAGRVGEAITAFEGLLPDHRRVMGKDHPDVLRTRNNLAHLFGEAGRVDEAIAAFEALLTDQRRILGEDCPDVLVTRNNLALCFGETGRVDEAVAAFEALLTDQRRVLGEDHPYVLKTCSNLAHWCGKAGRVDEAITAFEALLPDQRRILGEDHPDVLIARNNIAHWFGQAGRVDEAIAALEVLLPDQRRVLGEDHPSVLKMQNRIAEMKGAAPK